jgi:hypothetical protein
MSLLLSLNGLFAYASDDLRISAEQDLQRVAYQRTYRFKEGGNVTMGSPLAPSRERYHVSALLRHQRHNRRAGKIF